jgi:hypothetical protein
VSPASSQSSGTFDVVSSGYLVLRAAAGYLFAVEEERQVVWHLALVPDYPCQRACIALRCSSRTVNSLNATGRAAKQTTLSAQLLQFPLGSGIQTRRSGSAAGWRGCARRHLERRRWLERLKIGGLDGLDGGVGERHVAWRLSRRWGVFGREVCRRGEAVAHFGQAAARL